jgi:hypothetical protein
LVILIILNRIKLLVALNRHRILRCHQISSIFTPEPVNAIIVKLKEFPIMRIFFIIISTIRLREVKILNSLTHLLWCCKTLFLHLKISGFHRKEEIPQIMRIPGNNTMSWMGINICQYPPPRESHYQCSKTETHIRPRDQLIKLE